MQAGHEIFHEIQWDKYWKVEKENLGSLFFNLKMQEKNISKYLILSLSLRPNNCITLFLKSMQLVGTEKSMHSDLYVLGH